MRRQKECIAMLLAGGQGSRLQPLTENLAKPAVPFGGKYRIVDFALSSCANSGIDTVGVLTQYQPLVLNEYIGNGRPWDLDVGFGGVHILPPYQAKEGGEWYRGTANAVWQNKEFIARYAPKYVLVLSADHIYSMDYGALLRAHKKKGADVTVAVIEVEPREASRFGILSTNDEGEITAFTEKPKAPESNLASMGIYVFNTDYLMRHLKEDAEDEASQNDFGKNVIPKMLSEGGKLFAYRFSGYWRDVGTLESLWQANMDLLGDAPLFDLFSGKVSVYSNNETTAPQFVGDEGVVEGSLVAEGCLVLGAVKNSVLSSGIVVERGAVVKDSVLMNGVRVGEGALVEYAILDEGVTIAPDAVVGGARAKGVELTAIGRRVEA